MAGVSRNEGSFLAPKVDKQWTEQVFDELLQNSQNQFHGLDLKAVKDFYFAKIQNKSDSAAIRWAFYDFYGDVLITCPTYLFAKQLAKQTGTESLEEAYLELTGRTVRDETSLANNGLNVRTAIRNQNR